jgi:hypothetical protein
MNIKVALVNAIPRDDTPHSGAGTIYQMEGTSDWAYRVNTSPIQR